MKTVKQLLQAKGAAIHAIGPDASVLDAIKLMADKGIGALVVLDQGRLAGVVSVRDYARKVILHGRSPATRREKRDVHSFKRVLFEDFNRMWFSTKV